MVRKNYCSFCNFTPTKINSSMPDKVDNYTHKNTIDLNHS